MHVVSHVVNVWNLKPLNTENAHRNILENIFKLLDVFWCLNFTRISQKLQLKNYDDVISDKKTKDKP